MTPNIFAILILLSWPLVIILLYLSFSPTRATLWALIGAQLILPVGTILKFEGIPAFDKILIPNIAALFAYLVIVAPSMKQPARRYGLPDFLISVYVLSPFVTAAFNSDVLMFGTTVLPASGYYDALSAATTQIIALVPYFLGRTLFRSARTNEEVLKAMATSALILCVPLLFEIRMSPHLHIWLYGYTTSDFIQAVRSGGFRPMAFMGHPLFAAFYVMMGLVSAAALWKMGQKKVIGVPSIGGLSLLAIVLLLCKSLASIIYATVLVPLVVFSKSKLKMRIASALVGIALLYPILRLADVFPANSMVEAARYISDERAESLQFRFHQEEGLLRRASERFLFGWGRFGRSRLYDEETGKDASVTDGRWVITLGQFGLVGFIAEFGLLALSIFRAGSALKQSKSRLDELSLTTIALILSVFVLNLLPNAALLPLTWLFAGALMGRAESVQASLRRKPRIQSVEQLH